MDCNSFYCSCERLFRPDLNGKPVVVLSDNDGRLIALTPEAKALGFTMRGGVLPGPAPPGKVGVTAFSSNYTLYGDIFARVMRTLSTLVPIEQYSIDECFIPFYRATAVQTLDVGCAVHDRVSRWVGVPVRVGIGPTRTLAKLANLRAKNGPASSNLISIRRNWKRYWKRPPQAAYGYRPQTGRQTGADRHSQRPPTPGYGPGTNFAAADRSRATNDACTPGFQCIMEDQASIPRKTLINSRSFGRRVTRKEDLAQAMTMHCTIAGEWLRLEKMEAAGIRVHMETSRHMEEPYFSTSASVSIPVPTNSTGRLISAAMDVLDACYRPGHGYMKGRYPSARSAGAGRTADDPGRGGHRPCAGAAGQTHADP